MNLYMEMGVRRSMEKGHRDDGRVCKVSVCVDR